MNYPCIILENKSKNSKGVKANPMEDKSPKFNVYKYKAWTCCTLIVCKQNTYVSFSHNINNKGINFATSDKMLGKFVKVNVHTLNYLIMRLYVNEL